MDPEASNKRKIEELRSAPEGAPHPEPGAEPEHAKKRHAHTLSCAVRRRAELNQLITDVAGTLTNAPGGNTTAEKGKISILKTAADELRDAQEENRPSLPRKCKKLPRRLSSQVSAEKASFDVMWRHSQVGLFVANPNMEGLDANPFLLKTMGYQPFEISNCWSVVHKDSLKTAYREVGKVAKGQQKYTRLQGQILHKSGKYHWWHGHLQLVRKESVTGVLGVMVHSGERPVTRSVLGEMKLPGFPNNITPDHLAKAFAWARAWDEKKPQKFNNPLGFLEAQNPAEQAV